MVAYDARMRPYVLLPTILGMCLGVVTCGDDEGPDCDCAEVGCFADMCTKTVFVTAEPVTAKFGGVAVADQMCAQQAAAAGLPGTYLAWLSVTGTQPRGRFSESTVPYALPDGTQVAADWDALLTDGPSAPIDMTAAGAKAAGADDTKVWTGTDREGRADTYNNASTFCMNWSRNVIEESVIVGFLRKRGKAGDWTLGNLTPCTGDGYLYCFQQ